MAKLYYGNGECTIEGSEIRGVQIKYSGRIRVEKTANDNFVLIHNHNSIIIFPLGEGYLNELFNYNGTMKISSLVVANNNAESVKCIVKKVMDYSHMLESKAETMTTKSEDLSAGYTCILSNSAIASLRVAPGGGVDQESTFSAIGDDAASSVSVVGTKFLITAKTVTVNTTTTITIVGNETGGSVTIPYTVNKDPELDIVTSA